MPRTGENIYKRKDGRWEGRYIKERQPSGKAIWGYIYAYSYKEAKTKLNLAVSGQALPSKRSTQGSNFSDLSELWLESQKVRVKESTYNKYRNLLQNIYSHILGIYAYGSCRLCVSPSCAIHC